MTVDNDDYEYFDNGRSDKETFLEETICPICGLEHERGLVDKIMYFVDENNCRHPCDIQYFYCHCSNYSGNVYYFDNTLVEKNYHKLKSVMHESPRMAIKREKRIRNRIMAKILVGLIWDTVSKIYEKKDKKDRTKE